MELQYISLQELDDALPIIYFMLKLLFLYGNPRADGASEPKGGQLHIVLAGVTTAAAAAMAGQPLSLFNGLTFKCAFSRQRAVSKAKLSSEPISSARENVRVGRTGIQRSRTTQ